MNYKKIYNNLIEKAQNRILDSDTYFETHHIVPKCLGGTDDKDNLVKLTAEEHYLAHQLLIKIHPSHNGLSYAAIRMTIGKNSNRYNNKLYGWIRRKAAIDSSIRSKEYLKNNPHPKGMLGKTHSEETKEQQSISIRQAMIDNGLTKPVHQFTLDGVYIKKFESLQDAAKSVNGNTSNIKYTADGKYRYAYGYRWSYDETINHIMEEKKLVGNRGKMWITNGIKSITVDKDSEIPDGWWKGNTKSEKSNKSISMFKDGMKIAEYKSIKECTESSLELYGTYLYSTNIVKVLKGVYKQYKGYTFEYNK